MMRRFICHTIYFVLLSVGVMLPLLLGIVFYPNHYSRQSHEVNVALAAQRLDSLSKQHTPKIVILGGSGCNMGFRSDLLHTYFGMPVVNAGTHAGIGAYLYCTMYEDFLQSGDKVILIPEFDMYSDGCYALGWEDQQRILANNYPRGLLCRTMQQYLHSFRCLPQCFRHAVDCRHFVVDSLSPYSAQQLNEFGDATGWNMRQHVYSGTDVLPYPQAQAIQFFQRFIGSCKKKGIEVYLFPPTYNYSNFVANADAISQVETSLKEAGIPFCVSPAEFALPDSVFYDTSYHLLEEGAVLRTNKIIQIVQDAQAKP